LPQIDYALPVGDEWAAAGRHRTATSGASVKPAVLRISRPNGCRRIHARGGCPSRNGTWGTRR